MLIISLIIRERLGLVALVLGYIRDHAGVEIDFYRVAVFDPLRRLAALHYRQTDIDRIPVEYPREGRRDDAVYTRSLDRYRRVLARGAAAEVVVRDYYVALFNVVYEILIYILHAMRRKLCGNRGV